MTQPYTTTNINLVSYLLLKGYQYERTELIDGRLIVFYFSPEVAQIGEEWHYPAPDSEVRFVQDLFSRKDEVLAIIKSKKDVTGGWNEYRQN